ncbi:LRR receptor-like serine/threonine-protein kinase [Artemisia annua]|uniref:LRR receptor-like serine/threonine-protein kinase n=1 Tax=Artemisia annua TaxID=35608 RepID=A0A2U1NYF6_ARTAN|nr:LRR receptor-like serine/threonine-protein kinase [Artemisia annua]
MYPVSCDTGKYAIADGGLRCYRQAWNSCWKIVWYHPACINMTTDQAKQLADNFTCDREQCSDASASADPDMNVIGVGSSGVVYRARSINGETLAVTKMWPAQQSEEALRFLTRKICNQWPKWSFKADPEISASRDRADICDPKLRGQSTLDAKNAADTSRVVSMHQPTSWQLPNHEGCGCNAQGDPPRELDKHVVECQKEKERILTQNCKGHPLDTLPGGAHLVQCFLCHLHNKRDPLDIYDPKLRGQSTPDARNAADTSSVASISPHHGD